MQYDDFITHDIDMYMGKPKSGKTLIAGSYPKPLLYIAVGNDGGGRVLAGIPGIKVKNLKNDMPVGGKINKTSIDKLAELLAELRKPDADKFKTIVVDVVTALQDDYKAYLEFVKQGKSLSVQEWGDVAKMMLLSKDNMKRFSEEQHVKIVWVFHTSEQEAYETSGLQKEIRIVPNVTLKTGDKYLKDASNIFYCCRKSVLNSDGTKSVKFLTYVGPHPLMDTGTRDLYLFSGEFVENFSYNKWQEIVKAGKLTPITVLTAGDSSDNNDNANKKEEE